jgi:hypothetical protein
MEATKNTLNVSSLSKNSLVQEAREYLAKKTQMPMDTSLLMTFFWEEFSKEEKLLFIKTASIKDVLAAVLYTISSEVNEANELLDDDIANALRQAVEKNAEQINFNQILRFVPNMARQWIEFFGIDVVKKFTNIEESFKQIQEIVKTPEMIFEYAEIYSEYFLE